MVLPTVSTGLETRKNDLRIAAAKEVDAQWMILGLILFNLTVTWLNMYPLRFKERFMGMGNLRANSFIYKQATDTNGEGSVIVLNTEGDIGSYNRGNRSIHHFLENGLGFIASLPISFYLFPLPTFVLLCVYCLGRIGYQIGYSNSGFGGHFIGFFMDRLSSFTVLGLLILAYTNIVF